ncbi:hypothetical protein Golob_011075, partial [Gossypium lobatum]|nr:hypothetical protein [Gossypium lobatum]
MHLYIDGAVRNEKSFAAAARCIICKQNGEWMQGYNHYLGSCSILKLNFGGFLMVSYLASSSLPLIRRIPLFLQTVEQ